MSVDLEKLKTNGISLSFNEKGLKQFALMVADGCPRYIGSCGASGSQRIECPYKNNFNRKTCYKCWYKWLYNHSTQI